MDDYKSIITNDFEESIIYSHEDGYSTNMILDPFDNTKYCIYCGKRIKPTNTAPDSWASICKCEEAQKDLRNIQELSRRLKAIEKEIADVRSSVRPQQLALYKKLFKPHEQQRLLNTKAIEQAVEDLQ